MTTDLRALLRTAETVEQRCAAITAAIGHVLPDGPRDSPAHNARVTLYLLVERVRIGELPPTILLGVVAAMVPSDVSWSIEKGYFGPFAEIETATDTYRQQYTAKHPECALALAILDAMEARA